MLNSIKERDTSLDIIKFVSILMVVVLHVSSNGFTSSESRLWNGTNFFESFTRTCVPLFFMVTGALLGNRICTLTSSLSKIKRVIIPLLFWSVAYLVFFHFINKQEISLTSIISKPSAGHLWYLYTLIGVYLTMPILCSLLINTKQNIKYLILMLWFTSCVLIPSLKDYGFIISPYLDFSTIGLYQGYFFCGSVLVGIRSTRITRTIAMVIFLFMSLTILLLTRHLFEKDGLHDVRNYLNSSVFVCLASISAFLALHGISVKNTLIRRFIDAQSKCVFGIYLIHLFFVYLIGQFGFSISSSNVFYFIPLASLLIYIISLSLCYLMQKTILRPLIS